MEKIKEENKNLINLRTSLITLIIVLTGGIVGLSLAPDVTPTTTFWIIAGIYFDIIFLINVINTNNKINKNIGKIKNEL